MRKLTLQASTLSIVALLMMTCSTAGADDLLDALVERNAALYRDGTEINALMYRGEIDFNFNGVSEAACWNVASAETARNINPAVTRMLAKGTTSASMYVLGRDDALTHFLGQVHYQSDKCFLYAASQVLRGPEGERLSYQADISVTGLPIGSYAVSEVQVGAFRKEILPGVVETRQIGERWEIRAVAPEEINVVEVDDQQRPMRWTVLRPGGGIRSIVQWRYEKENKWPASCIVLIARRGPAEIRRYEILSIRPLDGSVESQMPIGKNVIVVDRRQSVVSPAIFEAQGPTPLTVADVLNAAEAKRSAENARKAVPPAQP
mgnify:CR=1 FL=1